MQVRTEAAHDFVKNENGTVGSRLAAQRFEKTRYRWYAAHVAGDGFDDDGSDVVAEPIHQAVKGFCIVVGQGNRIFCRSPGDARTVGLAEGGCTGAGTDEETVGMAVIAALEFYNLIAACKATGDA